MSAVVKLDDLGDVLTDRDLAALCQRAASWPRRERDRATRLGVTPDLPVTVPGLRQPRYTKVAVERWLLTGSSARTSLRRIS